MIHKGPARPATIKAAIARTITHMREVRTNHHHPIKRGLHGIQNPVREYLAEERERLEKMEALLND
jgi:hypothetical protein